VVGLDIDEKKVEKLNAGQLYTGDQALAAPFQFSMAAFGKSNPVKPDTNRNG
jgi:UDP-N-acetyl-D-mannosaminuronate dehydrogenase